MIMTVQCPSCLTSFPVDPNKVPDGGVSARCSVCPSIFRVEKEVPPERQEAESSWTDPPEAETVTEPSAVAVEVEAANANSSAADNTETHGTVRAAMGLAGKAGLAIGSAEFGWRGSPCCQWHARWTRGGALISRR